MSLIDQNPDKDTSYWHLDRRIPAALIMAIAVQTGGLVFWGATLESRVASLEKQITMLTTAGSPILQVRVARLEEQYVSTNALLLDIKDQLNEIRRDNRNDRHTR